MTDLTNTPEWRKAREAVAPLLRLAWPEEEDVAAVILTAALPHLRKLIEREAFEKALELVNAAGMEAHDAGDEAGAQALLGLKIAMEAIAQPRALSPKEPT